MTTAGKHSAGLGLGAKRDRLVDRAILVICFAFMLATYAMSRPQLDFMEYWTSAHQLVGGRNPYSLDQILQLERGLGWSARGPLMNLNPPWALPLVAPLGIFHSYRLTWFVSASLLGLIVWWSTVMLLRMYSPDRPVFSRETFLSQGLLAITFAPTIFSIKLAQTNSFVLLGLAGFLWFEQRKQYGLAGMCLALAAVKPHLVYLVWLALLFDCQRERAWKTIVFLFGGMAILTAAAAVMRPNVLGDYLELSRSGYTGIWASAVGGILRVVSGNARKHFAFQFLAPLAGSIWFLFYWQKHRHRWVWAERMPLVISVSVLTTAYGWMADQIVLLVPISAIAAEYVKNRGEIPRDAIAFYTAINVAVVVVLYATLKISFDSMNFVFPIAPLAAIFALTRRSLYAPAPTAPDLAAADAR